jgi:ArsR family transcriptional regulator, virulence genes transcriptional regulator
MEPGFPDQILLLAQQQANLCKVFSSAQRVLILWFLAERERTVSEIACAISASLPSTSQHLHLMELHAILESRREKQNIYYRLAENDLLRNCLVLANLPKEKLAELMPEL